MAQMTRSSWTTVGARMALTRIAVSGLAVSGLAVTGAAAQSSKDALQDLPSWKIPEICAKDSARSHCLNLESRAWRTVSGSWVSLPDSVKKICLGSARTPSDQSWRVLNDCVDEEMEKAGDRRAVNTRNTPAEAVPPAKQVAAVATPPPPPPPAPAAVPPPVTPAPAPVAATPPTPPPAPVAPPVAPVVQAPVAITVPAPILGMPTAPPPFAIDVEETRLRVEREQAARKAAADAEAARKAAEAAEAKRRADAEAEAARTAAAAAEAKRLVDAEAARKAAEAAEAKRIADAEAARKAALEAEARRVAKVCEDDLAAIAKDGMIRFAFASAALDRASNATLDKLGAAIAKCPGHRVRIEAHTDSVGEPEYNQNLSQRRAETVVAYLTKAGVSADLISAEGFGETQPIADNTTQEGRAQNRRIAFKVLPKP